MKLPRFLAAAIAGLLCSCSAIEQSEFQSWLDSPTTQSELASMQGFAFSLLMAWLQNGAPTARQAAAPDFAGCEPSIITAVQKRYGLNAVQAAYVVHQAESQITASVAKRAAVHL